MKQQESQLIEALLERALSPDSDLDELRVQDVMRKIAADNDSTALPQNQPAKARILTLKTMPRWISIPTIAAGILAVAVLIIPGDSDQPQVRALAALEASMQAESHPGTRQYEITVQPTTLRFRKPRARHHQLFLNGSQFVLQTLPPFGTGKPVAGGDKTTRWIIPRSGPVLLGKPGLFQRNRLTRASVEVPFMSLSEILEKTKTHFELNLEPSQEILQNGETHVCTKISGRRITDDKTLLPESVEIWIDNETDFARKVLLKWNPDDQSKWASFSAELSGMPYLSNEFFDYQMHLINTSPEDRGD